MMRHVRYWVAVHKTRDVYIRRRRVPLAEFYCSIREDFHIAYVNGTRASNIEVAPACGGVEVGGIAILPVSRNSEGWLGFERNCQGTAIPDMRFGDHIHVPTQRAVS
jgi:hypothetical protein